MKTTILKTSRVEPISSLRTGECWKHWKSYCRIRCLWHLQRVLHWQAQSLPQSWHDCHKREIAVRCYSAKVPPFLQYYSATRNDRQEKHDRCEWRFTWRAARLEFLFWRFDNGEIGAFQICARGVLDLKRPKSLNAGLAHSNERAHACCALKFC